MAKITVYQYETYDSPTGNYIRSKMPAVRKAIDSVDGVILFDTAMEIDLELVDLDGKVTALPSKNR